MLDPIPSIKWNADNYSRSSKSLCRCVDARLDASPWLVSGRVRSSVGERRRRRRVLYDISKPFSCPIKICFDPGGSHLQREYYSTWTFFRKHRNVYALGAPVAAPPWRVVFFSRIYARYSNVFIITSTYIHVYIFFLLISFSFFLANLSF